MRSLRLPPWAALLVAIIVAILSAFTYSIFDDDGDGRPDRVQITPKTSDIPAPAAVGVDGPDADAKPDDSLELDREAREVFQNATATPERYDLAGDLRGDDSTPIAKHTGPLATPNFPGCETKILPTNWSQRTSAVRASAPHYTAGLNRPGKSDMNGLTAYASSPIAGVSWHFLIDAEGHCYYSVPLSKKAWTIGNLNSQTVNIEVIGTGREPLFPAAAAGQMKLTQVLLGIHRIYNLPIRLGAASNCTVTRTGVITHWMGGVCAGGHIDIKPYRIETIVERMRAGAPLTSSCTKYDPCGYTTKVLTAGEKRLVNELLFRRRVAARHGGWAKIDAEHQRAADKAKTALRARRNELARLGLTKKNHRGARYAVIGQVIKAK